MKQSRNRRVDNRQVGLALQSETRHWPSFGPATQALQLSASEKGSTEPTETLCGREMYATVGASGPEDSRFERRFHQSPLWIRLPSPIMLVPLAFSVFPLDSNL
ncbi:hypothetical protein HNY73_002867 [Argiope bruennichi]|uniref:Uncharacterized protein n=1 Tax=Argiope bruennichi TaxID=94029 RepID=A0A8T0FZA2_ARGBR|nr:hypothetical protein HNY73_002867 [Argiope bruennichi]